MMVTAICYEVRVRHCGERLPNSYRVLALDAGQACAKVEEKYDQVPEAFSQNGKAVIRGFRGYTFTARQVGKMVV